MAIPTDQPAGARITEIEGLRGLLAVWVVVVHLAGMTGYKDFGLFWPVFDDGIRVKVFFIISGFVIFMLLARRRESYAAFVSARLLRLYPLYILAFFLTFALYDLVGNAVSHADFLGGTAQHIRLLIMQSSQRYWEYQVLAHVTLLHSLVPTTLLPAAPWAFLHQGWNIGTEFQFYVVAPLLFFGLSRGGALRRIGFAVAVVVFMIWARQLYNQTALSHYLQYFAVGIASYFIWSSALGRTTLFSPMLLWIGVAAAAYFDWAMAIWLLVFGSILVERNRQLAKGWLARALNTRPLQFFGGISYALYLFHMLPMYAAMAMLNGAGFSQAGYLAALSVMTFATAVPLSWAASILVERRFYDRNRRQAAVVAMADAKQS